jgi:hypothetical protein
MASMSTALRICMSLSIEVYWRKGMLICRTSMGDRHRWRKRNDISMYIVAVATVQPKNSISELKS